MHEHITDVKYPVFVVLGPTASGKSTLAMNVARKLDGEIISVDALKVYRQMDIGTAKPSTEERAEIPHHGVDLIDPSEPYSVSEFLDYAKPVIADIVERKKLPILDATAPFYLKALMYGLDRGPKPQPEFRAEMEARPVLDLYEDLKIIDPPSAERIGPSDQKRLVRALEIAKFSDILPSEVEKWAEPDPTYRWVVTGIQWPRENLYARVIKRAQQMFDAGWLDEVKGILANEGFSETAGKAHGYWRLQQYLQAEFDLDECVRLTIKDVKTFARKSMTFFKQFPKVQWLQVESDEEIIRASHYLGHEIKEMLALVGVDRPVVDL
ncbi:MAG: tRNA (adenosine(37)-N6)-dimethylallyltransferase MiaA [Planctomycetes bacterium]|nr:tRNA (adenosine(37)-N6)-dimethylallyltransferase MiaA [Planctomycetota bacterium]